MLSIYLESPAVAAPGLETWSDAQRVLMGQRPYRSAPLVDQMPDILPTTAQRRCSASTLLAVRTAQESLAGASCSADAMTSVFASSVGDPQITDQLCRALVCPEPVVSPTRFHNSVHNAPAAYWSIATGSLRATTSLSAYDGTFAAALLAASVRCIAERSAVLLVAYDQPFPDPLSQSRRLNAPFACAVIATPERTKASLLQCRLTLTDTETRLTIMEQPELEALRNACPAARALPLLRQLSAPDQTTVVLEYLDDTNLVLECLSC